LATDTKSVLEHTYNFAATDWFCPEDAR